MDEFSWNMVTTGNSTYVLFNFLPLISPVRQPYEVKARHLYRYYCVCVQSWNCICLIVLQVG
jgi:hypothetical protein